MDRLSVLFTAQLLLVVYEALLTQVVLFNGVVDDVKVLEDVAVLFPLGTAVRAVEQKLLYCVLGCKSPCKCYVKHCWR